MPDRELPGTLETKHGTVCANPSPRSTTGPETEASAAATPVLDLRGYELMERLGGGGMGDVYRASDPALGRDLAVKVLKDELRLFPSAQSRFLREARVTGSLQHPGIVPVYNLGRLADGRLHYTMRLVRGSTLADILREEAGRLERVPALLAIFEKVCQAVAYAHSKRVIHRDLKPANVMVGRFGEAQVMDWGLAKLLTPGERGCVSAPSEATAEPGGTQIHTEAEETPPAVTRLGREMGTPAYMPPEQALGEWDTVDERADVFALGAILCEILTGQPPYCGNESAEALRKAKRGDLTEALTRLEGCGADAALVALCRNCLAPASEDRPRDAEQVAQRVAAYQVEVQERLRRAELERAAAVVKAREERKKRRWMWTAMVGLLAGASVSTWLAVRTKQAKDLAQNRLGQIEKSKDVLASIFRDLDPRAEKKGGPKLSLQLSQHLEKAAAQLDETAVDDPMAAAHLRIVLGKSLINLGQAELAIEQLSKAGMVLESQLGPDDPDTLNARHHLAEAFLAAGRTAEAIPVLEQTLKQREATLEPDHPDTLRSRNNLAEAYRSAGRIADAIRLHEQNLEKQESQLGTDDPDTLLSRNNLAVAYWSAGRTADAIRLYEQTLKLMETKLGTDHPNTLGTRNNLAEAYRSAGRSADAIRLHEQNLKKQESKLGTDHPDTLGSRNNLASAYWSASRTADAIRLYEQNLKFCEAKLGADHPHTLKAMANLGATYRDAGRPLEAIPLLETALQRGRERPEGLPTLLVNVPVSLALTLERAGQLVKAESICRDSLELFQRQFGHDDARTAGVLAQLGRNLVKQKKFRDAEPLLRQSATIYEQKQPDVWTTFDTRSTLGEALLGQKKYAEAEPLLLQGYEGMKQRQDKIPPAHRQIRLPEALERLVRLYEATDQKEKAAGWRKKLQETKAAPKKTKRSVMGFVIYQ